MSEMAIFRQLRLFAREGHDQLSTPRFRSNRKMSLLYGLTAYTSPELSPPVRLLP
jgi:hypothetical protein